jgi:hypothetical protein
MNEADHSHHLVSRLKTCGSYNSTPKYSFVICAGSSNALDQHRVTGCTGSSNALDQHRVTGCHRRCSRLFLLNYRQTVGAASQHLPQLTLSKLFPIPTKQGHLTPEFKYKFVILWAKISFATETEPSQQTELRESLLSFGVDSFAFQFAI